MVLKSVGDKMNSENARIKICRVCGDRATGFNFNALTCGPCKTFFRRNALKNESLNICPFNENCIVAVSTRKFCPFCRLKKCFKVGMKKELVLRRNDANSLTILRIYKNTIDLKGHEFVRLSELRTAVSAFCEENSLPEVVEAKNLLQVANLEGHSVSRVIKFCKSLPAFGALQQQDQLILLKSFFSEKGIVRGAFHCDQKRDGFYLIDDTSKDKSVFVKFNLLAEFTQPGAYFVFKNFASLLQNEMKDDAIIRDLLLAIRLFQPRQYLSCPETMHYQHVLYNYLLRRYLEQKHASVSIANSKYHSLMRILGQIDQVSSCMSAIMEHLNSKQREQMENVLFEIYNLA